MYIREVTAARKSPDDDSASAAILEAGIEEEMRSRSTMRFSAFLTNVLATGFILMVCTYNKRCEIAVVATSHTCGWLESLSMNK